MKKTRYTEEQIALVLKHAETGNRVGEVCRKMGISEFTFTSMDSLLLQVLNLVLGCCLHLSGIRKICAQMG
ncbi:transposase, partial [Klebsiella variicola]|uniref:transposase n=1 Tax=Klebsiella variicola TaxID=244366 RepID=UPI0021ACEB63